MGEYTEDGLPGFKSGNPGRPKGSKSEKAKIWEDIGEWFTSDAMELYQENLEGMLSSGNPVQKLEGMKRYEALLEYFKPKLSRQDGTVEHKGDIPITINKKYNDGKID